MEQNNLLNSWDAFTGGVLKAQDVRSDKDEYIIIQLSHDEQDGRTKLVLTLERNKVQKQFYLNATNTKILRDKTKTPQELVGKVITFSKMKVNNPQTGAVQDSLVIDSVK